MNERIKELFNKASVYAYEQNPGENSYGRPVDENKYEEDRYTKFAELIVRECASLNKSQSYELTGVITDTEEGDGFDDVCLNTVKRVADYLGDDSLAKHFGVEE